MTSNFCGCCPLRMAVRNISIYTLVVYMFDSMYCIYVKNELIFPSKYIYKYPPNYATAEITGFLALLYGLLALSSVLLFISTFLSDARLVLPYLATQMAKALSEAALLLVGAALAPWNHRHAYVTLLLLLLRAATLTWDLYLMATAFSFMQVSKY